MDCGRASGKGCMVHHDQYYIMIHQQEQERVDTINNKVEEIRKSVKMYHKYITEVELEQQSKKTQQVIKQYQGQLLLPKEDNLNLGQNIMEMLNLLDNVSKIFIQQHQEFSAFSAQSFEEYYDKLNGYQKRIIDFNNNNLKVLSNSRQGFKKSKEKYEKTCKEIEQAFQDQKKNLEIANTGYNVQIGDKSQVKLKDLLKSVDQCEQNVQDFSEMVSVKSQEFKDGLEEAYKQLKIAYKSACEKLIEITMKYDQHNLLSFNWLKGYYEDKNDKILAIQKFEANQEDKVVQQKCEALSSNDVILRQMKYSELVDKIMAQGNLVELEYIMFGDMLQRYVDVQINLIADRIKNLKTFQHFLLDLSTTWENSQKALIKHIKANQVSDKLQDSNSYAKKLSTIQENLANFHDGYSKRIYQLLQFNTMKANAIETIIKDQKAQERSFMNMYSKMLKDILSLKSQIQQFDHPEKKTMASLKKIIHDSVPIIHYSLDQIRSVEAQRSQQVVNIMGSILQQYVVFVDENIKNIKQLEESLNKRFDSIDQEIESLPGIALSVEPQQTYQFVKIFQMTQEIQAFLEQQQQHFEEQQSELKQDDDDDKNLEEGAVKVSQSLLAKFKVVEGERCLASYACAFDNKILLQGRLYVFSYRICFHSYFNAKTLFGKTILVIPASEIHQVKKSKSYLIDNAIEFQTIKGHLVFTSFINRESTIAQIKQVKGLAECLVDDKDKLIDKSTLSLPLPTQEKQDEEHKSLELKEQPPLKQGFSTPEKAQLQQPQSEQAQVQQTQSQPQPQQPQPQPQTQQAQQPQQPQQQQPQPQQQQPQQPQSNNSSCVKQPPERSSSLTKQQRPAEQSDQKQEVLQQRSKSPIPIAQVKEQPIEAPETKPFVQEASLYEQAMVKEKSQRFMNQNGLSKYVLELNLTAREIVSELFVDKPYKQYQSFFEYFQVEYLKDKEMKYQKYQPDFSWGSIGQPFRRTLTFLHPVKEKNMFTPDFAGCSASDTLFVFNEKEALQEKEISFTKIPYGDHFRFRSFYHIKEENAKSVVVYGYYIHFVKKTMLQGKIESSSKNENKEIWEKGLIRHFKEEEKRLRPDEEEKKEEGKKEEGKNEEEKKEEGKQEDAKKEVVEEEVGTEEIRRLERKVEQLTQLVQLLIGLVVGNLLLGMIR